MKFSQKKYTRPDIAKESSELDRLIATFSDSDQAEKAAKAVHEINALLSKLSDLQTIASIRYTQNTTDEFYESEQEFFAENMPPIVEKVAGFYTALLNSPHRAQLEKVFPKVLFTNADIAARSINKEVLPLLEQEEKLILEYQKVQSTITIDYDGQKLTIPQMGKYTTSADRAVRKAATEAVGGAMLAKKEQYDEVFDKLVKVRTEIAKKLGFASFTEVGYLRMTRNCYDQNDVKIFRDQVKTMVVPLVSKLMKGQAERLGVDKLKFYDQAVLSKQGNPTPIANDEQLYQIGLQLYKDMKPETKALIEKMDENGMFDLFSRENKMTGGYCAMLNGDGVPFVFANFNGTVGDVDVFTHEGGHALAGFLNAQDELEALIDPTAEACEVHSMSMEFLCWPYLDRFYAERSEQAKALHLVTSLYFLPYGCLVDEFQHEIYANPNQTPEQRLQLWIDLEKQYFPDMDYDGMPFYGDGRRWQRQLHIYEAPFYYIDYCLASACAMQVLSVMLTDGWDAAWDMYIKYTKIGRGNTFVEMLQKSGFKTPFEQGALTTVVDKIEGFIEKNIGNL